MRASRYRIRTPRALPYPGERRARRAGFGEEFYDHRYYVPGDDPRLIDWKASARVGRPVVRRREEARSGRFWLWVDGSKSMELYDKAAYAERVARVLIAAATGERLRLAAKGRLVRPGREVLKDEQGLLKARPRHPGTPLLITDGLEEGDFAGYLKTLPPFHLILVLAEEELEPKGPFGRLVDVETKESVPVEKRSVSAYKRALREALALLARRRGNLALLRVGEPVVPALYREGVIELR